MTRAVTLTKARPRHLQKTQPAKVAGTERGIKEPVPSFSACFGAAFLLLDPIIYARELTRKMKAHNADAWLVNTGWMGGPYGTVKHGSGQQVTLQKNS